MRQTQRRLGAAPGPTSAGTAHTRHWFEWGLLGAAFALHVPVAMCEGLGRDEAAYVVWAFHPEPAYSPLLQALIRACVPTPGFAAHQPRLAAWALCGVVTWLAARRTRPGGAPAGAAWCAAVALASSPWQAYVGPLLHPDNALLAAMLLMVLAARAGHPVRLAGATLLAMAAKPTGLLLVPAACAALQLCDAPQRRRSRMAQGIVLIAAVACASLIRPATARAMAQFAKMASETPASTRVAAAVLPIVLGAGPLLLVGAVVGTRARWGLLRRRTAAPPTAIREAVLVLLAAATFVLFFAVAGLGNGQVKGTWLLPPIALLWPTAGLPRWGAWSRAAALAALAVSAVLAAAFLDPSWVARLEARGVPAGLAYAGHAGQREARVSSSRGWSDRLREYDSARPFALAVRHDWEACDGDGGSGSPGRDAPRRGGDPREQSPGPAWVVSDDYGLAAQLLCAWGDPRPRVILPQDGIFDRTLPPRGMLAQVPPTLVLAVRGSADALWPPLGPVVHCGAVPHPITGADVVVAKARTARGPRSD